MSEPIVVLDAVRTPFGRFGGALRTVGLPQLAAAVTVPLLGRLDVGAGAVDEYVLGVNLPGADRSIARQAALRSGIPDDRLAYTVDRACCSALTAVRLGCGSLASGESSFVLAGGAENLSKVPYFLEDLRWGHRLGAVTLADQLVISCPHTGQPRAQQAADEAARYGVDRRQQDEWAARSQHRYAAARDSGRFADEIVPIAVGDASLDTDEGPRSGVTVEDLGQLPTVYGSATVTAGNAPGLSTGATMTALMRRPDAERAGRPILAEILTSVHASGHPGRIASIPAVAADKALARTRLTIDEIDLIEVNEAFAAVPLVATLLLAGGDPDAATKLRERTNVNGGAIAVGHPTGASGARLLMTAAYELRRRGGGTALIAICGGIGEAEAVIIRVG